MQHGPDQPTDPPSDEQSTLGSPQDDQIEQHEDQRSDTQSDQTHAAEQSRSVFESIIPESREDMFPPFLLVGGVLIGFMILMRTTRKQSAHRTAKTNAMRNPGDRISELHRQASAATEPVQKALIHLEEVSRRYAATMDNKAARLEQLIEDAEERIEILQSLGGSTDEAQEQLDQIHPDDPPSISWSSVSPEALDRARVEEDRAERSKEPQLDDQRSPGSLGPVHQEPGQPKSQTSQDRVNELASQGLSAEQIAQELGKPIGHIQLMLNIRRNSG